MNRFKGLVVLLVAAVIAPSSARAQLTGRGLSWDYWAYGGLYTGPVNFTGGSCGGDFQYYFSVCTTDNTITFQYLQSSPTSHWSPSGPSNGNGFIHNGISVFYNDAGANDILSVAIDGATNMVGFNSSNVAVFNNNEVDVNWVDLPFDPSTVVELDLNSSVTPEPATLVLLGTGLLGIGGVVRRRRKSIES